jgi:sodium transport system permease protein
MFAVALPLSIFFPALQLLVSSVARTVKEAQVYLSLLTFAPMLPGFLSAFEPIDPSPLVALVPVLSQHILLTDVLAGSADLELYLATSLWTAVLGAALLLLSAELLRRERVIFGRR